MAKELRFACVVLRVMAAVLGCMVHVGPEPTQQARFFVAGCVAVYVMLGLPLHLLHREQESVALPVQSS